MNISPITSSPQNCPAASPFRTSRCHKPHSANRISSPLINAAFQAFEAYVAIKEVEHTALIASVATYALSPNGAAKPLSPAQLAPLYALNLLA